MDHESPVFRRSCPRRSVRTALPPAAGPPASCDTGRAAAGRAGSFNSGKNGRFGYLSPTLSTFRVGYTRCVLVKHALLVDVDAISCNITYGQCSVECLYTALIVVCMR